MNTQKAELNCRVRRQPASLGNYHYHIEAGKTVYILWKNSTHATVSTIPLDDCISDDLFRVPLSFLTFAA